MASPGLSELVTTTARSRTGKLSDNMSDNNAILYQMKKKGSMDPADGGRSIVQELEYGEHAVQRYSGAETLGIAPADVATAAEYDWKQMAVAITFNGLETHVQNTGDEQLIKLVTMRVKNAEKSANNTMSSDFYSDGTASSGKQIGGLQLLVADDPTTGIVGGINRGTAANAFYRNKNFDISVSGSGAASSTNIRGYMQTLWLRLIRGTDRPDVIMSANDFYSLFWSSLADIQRITDAKMADAGFENIKFSNCPVVPDGGGDTAQGGRCPDSHMYFLNTESGIKYRPHSGRDWVPLDDVQSINSDATVKFLVWAGNMTAANPSLCGVLNA